MDKRKLQAVINRIEDDISALKHWLKSQYKRREKVDVDVIVDQYDNEVIGVEAYHIDLHIECVRGNIDAYEDILKRLNMLKESINK
jgi:hypothetical protein